MVTKLEIVLLFVLLIFSASWLQESTQSNKKKSKKSGEQAHLLDSRLIEIDVNGSKRVVEASDVKQYKDRADFKVFYYKSDKVELSSDFAREKKMIYTLWDNVIATKPDGSTYKGKKAIYAKKSETLQFANKFNLNDAGNSIVGKKMHYDEASRSVKAKDVKAVFDMPTMGEKKTE